jgi:hypothetical protein
MIRLLLCVSMIVHLGALIDAQCKKFVLQYHECRNADTESNVR